MKKKTKKKKKKGGGRGREGKRVWIRVWLSEVVGQIHSMVTHFFQLQGYMDTATACIDKNRFTICLMCTVNLSAWFTPTLHTDADGIKWMTLCL